MAAVSWACLKTSENDAKPVFFGSRSSRCDNEKPQPTESSVEIRPTVPKLRPVAQNRQTQQHIYAGCYSELVNYWLSYWLTWGGHISGHVKNLLGIDIPPYVKVPSDSLYFHSPARSSFKICAKKLNFQIHSGEPPKWLFRTPQVNVKLRRMRPIDAIADFWLFF